MAECLQISQDKKDDSDTEDDDYEEYCDHFTYSVSAPTIFHMIHFTVQFIFYSKHRLVVYAMDIMHQVLVNRYVVLVMHFYFLSSKRNVQQIYQTMMKIRAMMNHHIEI